MDYRVRPPRYTVGQVVDTWLILRHWNAKNPNTNGHIHMYAIECIVCQNNREADQSRLAKVERGERGEIGCTCRKKGRTPKVKPVRLSEVTGPYSLEPLKSINDFGYNPKERLSEVRV